METGRDSFYRNHKKENWTPRELERSLILKEIRKIIPTPYSDELAGYVEAVLDDAIRRKYKFSIFNMVIRTELFTGGFHEGHNHGHGGDLNYARAEIGPNTDVDRANRFKPSLINDSDYISTKGSSNTIVLGDVWHRTPPLPKGAKRLYILIELIP